MDVVFSSHAVARMIERGLSAELIETIIKRPNGKARQSRDKWVLWKRIPGRTDNLIAVVVVESSFGTIEVITVLVNFEVKV